MPSVLQDTLRGEGWFTQEESYFYLIEESFLLVAHGRGFLELKEKCVIEKWGIFEVSWEEGDFWELLYRVILGGFTEIGAFFKSVFEGYINEFFCKGDGVLWGVNAEWERSF